MGGWGSGGGGDSFLAAGFWERGVSRDFLGVSSSILGLFGILRGDCWASGDVIIQISHVSLAVANFFYLIF